MQHQLEKLPNDPGIYIFKNQKERIIYIGKAKNLRKRVKSYFRSKINHPRTRSLVKNIHDLEVILTKTEVEALLLERNLIKQHQPKYNILLRDDKAFPLVRIDYNSQWPRVSKVRKRRDDGATYLGPFVNESQLYKMLKAAYRIFPLVRCSDHEFRTAKRPCNYYHMKLCLGPCTLDVDRDKYIEMVQSAGQFLQGKNKELLKSIEEKMYAYSDREDYTSAALMRDQLHALQKAVQPQHVEFQNIQAADAIGMVYKDDLISLNIVSVRDEKLSRSQSYHFELESNDEPDDVLMQFIIQFYDTYAPPKNIFLSQHFQDFISDYRELSQALRDLTQKPIQIQTPQKGKKMGLMEIAQKNARYQFDQYKTRQKKTKVILESIQKELKLQNYPLNIECIDISNLQSDAIVASKVCFTDAKPNPNRYRHYNLKSVHSQNDFASITEVVSRRLQRGLEEGDLPQLLVIDGGKGQLEAAHKALQQFPEADIELVSLAKSRVLEQADKLGTAPIHGDERIFKLNAPRPITLQPGTQAFRVLTHLRDEAHRFAITFHRKKRDSKAVESELDLIPGIGPKLRNQLLTTFGSINTIKNASINQLAHVKGVSDRLAQVIHAWFRTES